MKMVIPEIHLLWLIALATKLHLISKWIYIVTTESYVEKSWAGFDWWSLLS